jgi:8-oxo-dGTP diphosphatase
MPPMTYCYDYPRPALTVDCVVFGFTAAEQLTEQLKVLLIQRGLPPFEGQWALPGGFVMMNESLDEAARRELVEETGVKDLFLEQLYTFGEVQRDPRDRVVSVAYYALISLQDHPTQAATDAKDVGWYPIMVAADDPLVNLPDLAFDHRQILTQALQRLQNKIRYEPVGFELLPPKFTLTQLQQLYETILGQTLDKRNFRKKLLKMDLLIPLPEKQLGVPHRAPRLYQFDHERYRSLRQSGFVFDL